jgi:hypothetical protein
MTNPLDQAILRSLGATEAAQQLAGLTRSELAYIARQLGIRGTKTSDKESLVHAILAVTHPQKKEIKGGPEYQQEAFL